MAVGCHRADCLACQCSWRMDVADKIRYGAAQLEAAGKSLRFVTMTIRDDPDRAKTPADLLERLMSGFK